MELSFAVDGVDAVDWVDTLILLSGIQRRLRSSFRRISSRQFMTPFRSARRLIAFLRESGHSSPIAGFTWVFLPSGIAMH